MKCNLRRFCIIRCKIPKFNEIWPKGNDILAIFDMSTKRTIRSIVAIIDNSLPFVTPFTNPPYFLTAPCSDFRRFEISIPGWMPLRS